MLIGYGQVNHRDEIDPETRSVEPVDLMAAAARQAADSRVLEAVDSIRVVNVLSAHYRDPGLLLGERIGAADFTTLYSPRRRQRAAVAGQPGLPGHPAGPRRRGAACRRRNLAHPKRAEGQGRQTGVDGSGRIRADGRGQRRRRADGR